MFCKNGISLEVATGISRKKDGFEENTFKIIGGIRRGSGGRSVLW